MSSHGFRTYIIVTILIGSLGCSSVVRIPSDATHDTGQPAKLRAGWDIEPWVATIDGHPAQSSGEELGFFLTLGARRVTWEVAAGPHEIIVEVPQSKGGRTTIPRTVTRCSARFDAEAGHEYWIRGSNSLDQTVGFILTETGSQTSPTATFSCQREP